MNAERSHVGSGFAAHPKNAQTLFLVILEEFAFVNLADSELSLDRGNCRRLLKDCACQVFEGLFELAL